MREITKLNSIEKLKSIINNRIVCIIARGASTSVLEKRIEEFKDYNVCWASMNLFTPAEKIVNKIGKSLELVSDCSNVKNTKEYEPQVRIPRFEEYLKKNNNLLFISDTVITDVFKNHNKMDLFERYKDKIASIEDVFDTPNAPSTIWEAPPNSITLLFAACIAGGAKKIICFGYDGLKGVDSVERSHLDKNALNTYYESELEGQDRTIAANQEEIGSLATDSFFFERDWLKIWEIYKTTYNNSCAIVNCSPESMFTIIKKVDYNEVHEELKGEKNELE